MGRWSVRKTSEQLRDSIIIDGLIFIVTEIVTATSILFWRPLVWSMAWIACTIIVSALGLLANHYRSTYGLIMFAVLQLMFSAINLQHVNMSHSEAVRGCSTRQAFYQNCEVPALYHCIYDNKCKVAEMSSVTPKCHAPGSLECDQFAGMAELAFWGNQMINFFTYAEPTFWAVMTVIRMEMTLHDEG